MLLLKTFLPENCPSSSGLVEITAGMSPKDEMGQGRKVSAGAEAPVRLAVGTLLEGAVFGTC